MRFFFYKMKNTINYLQNIIYIYIYFDFVNFNLVLISILILID